MRPLPRAVLLVSWGTAALTGRVSPDVAAERVARDDTRHRVTGLPEEPGEVSCAVALHRLRAAGTDGLLLALPVPGDAAGLPGPPAFNADALEAGQAVLTAGGPPLGLVPHVDVRGGPGERMSLVEWRAAPVTPSVAAGVDHGVTLPEAERLLREDLAATADSLAEMDVARWRPEAAERLEAVRAPVPEADTLPPGYDGRAHRVLALARRLEAVVDLALEEPGGAQASTAVRARTGHLRALATRARQAQVAACNSWRGATG
jgi:hypothetical protein